MHGTENPYIRPPETWKDGTAVYQCFTYCPYCGSHMHHNIKRIQGAWFWLQCRSCARDYKVRSKAK